MLPTEDQLSIPPPPRLHWGWVLLLGCLTGWWFGAFWFLKQARWGRRVHGVSRVYGWAIVYLVFQTASVAFFIVHLAAMLSGQASPSATPSSGFLEGAIFILYPVVGFGLQSEFEGPPFGMELSGWMVFFWGPVYLQYWLGKFGAQTAQALDGPVEPVT